MTARVVIATAAALLVAGCGSSESTLRPTAVRPEQRVYTLGAGDRARIPAAGVTCAASREGGRENLSCARIGGGRVAVVFYPDSVVVWENPEDADSYSWGGRRAPTLYRPRRRVFTLEAPALGAGDRFNAPAAGTTCTVTRGSGRTELACMPMGGGRYRVSLFRSLVLVWDVLAGRESPVTEYEWARHDR